MAHMHMFFPLVLVLVLDSAECSARSGTVSGPILISLQCK
jgi:hypothetical protein